MKRHPDFLEYLLRAALFFLLFAAVVKAWSQAEPPDHSPDKTHKAQHERTPHYKADGKTKCGTLIEMKSGQWRAWRAEGAPGGMSAVFETREEARKWLRLYCPVAGKQGHD